MDGFAGVRFIGFFWNRKPPPRRSSGWGLLGGENSMDNRPDGDTGSDITSWTGDIVGTDVPLPFFRFLSSDWILKGNCLPR